MHQKLQLWLDILTTKWHIFVQNMVALIIKNSKDSKNGAKSYHRPLNHSFLRNPLKKLWYRYFNIGASKFFKMHLKFIFSISLFIWIWNYSWKLISLCTGLCLLCWIGSLSLRRTGGRRTWSCGRIPWRFRRARPGSGTGPGTSPHLASGQVFWKGWVMLQNSKWIILDAYWDIEDCLGVSKMFRLCFLSNSWAIYRMTQKNCENLLLTQIWNVPSSCLGRR